MNSRFIFLCLIFVYYNVNAQSNVELKLLDQQRMLEEERQKSQQPNLLFEQESTPTLKSLADDDDDGMDDDWEIQHGLDPNDPADAWQDADGDYVLNLFEAQLITDPNDADSPAKVDFDNSDIQAIEGILNTADEQKLVVRLSEGEYLMNYLQYFNTDYYIMIQGGWNEDFTVHDPSTYRTIINGGSNEAIQIGDSDGMNYSAIILQGLEVAQSGGFSLWGGVQIIRRSLINRTSVYDCQFYNNNYYGFGILHWILPEMSDSQLFFVNTGVSNNSTGGIRTHSTKNSNARWRIINTSIHNPNSSDGGVDGLTLNDGNLNIELHNAINWGNGNYSFNFFADDILSVLAKNCVIDNVDPDIDDYTEFNNLMTDPLFVDVPNNDLSLAENSPCIDAGANLGLPYAGDAPDIGSEEHGTITSTTTADKQAIFNLIPNILQAGNRRIVLNGLPDVAECTVYLFDEQGRIITQNNITTSGGQIYYSIADYLSAGTYFISVDYNGYTFPAQRLVIVE